jgi:inner membrane protein
MPSPIGHALGGLSAGWLVDGARRDRLWLRQATLFGGIGILPDVDLLFGWHSGPTHSMGAAFIAALVAWAIVSAKQRRSGPHVGRSAVVFRPSALSFAVFAAYTSHVLLDWLGEDTTPPYGVMALWPFTREYFIAPVAIMPAISRRYWLPGFFAHNLRAVLFEVAVLGPIAGIAWLARRRSGATTVE